MAENPEDPLPHLSLADTLTRMGGPERWAEATAEMEEAVRLSGRMQASLGMMAGFYGVAGNEDRASEILEELEERQRAGYVSGFWMAVALSGMGRIDDAFDSLERALENRDSNMVYLIAIPRQLNLHDDPRFRSILERIGLGHLTRFL
jgi:hypothetical protein